MTTRSRIRPPVAGIHLSIGSTGVITGDPDTYGRVYVGTNGRGLLYGDPS